MSFDLASSYSSTDSDMTWPIRIPTAQRQVPERFFHSSPMRSATVSPFSELSDAETEESSSKVCLNCSHCFYPGTGSGKYFCGKGAYLRAVSYLSVTVIDAFLTYYRLPHMLHALPTTLWRRVLQLHVIT